MTEKPERLIAFPDELPAISKALLLSEKELVTGHSNGMVAIWDLQKGSHQVLQNLSSRVRALESSSSGKVLVGCYSGLTILLDVKRPSSFSLVREGPDTVASRVFSACLVGEDDVVIGSTYGEVSRYTPGARAWTTSRIGGHSQGVIAVAGNSAGLLATGDYQGNIVVSRVTRAGARLLSRISAPSSVEGLGWSPGGNILSAISTNGNISVFEPNADQTTWKPVLKAEVARSAGRSVLVTSEGKTAIGCCHEEVLQVDIDRQQAGILSKRNAIQAFVIGPNFYVIAADGVWRIARHELKVDEKLIKFRYTKVAVLGHTGVGKSTLCKAILDGAVGDANLESTFGRRVWIWDLTSGAAQRRVVLNDSGGQFSSVETLLPLAADSDIVLGCFQQNDTTTLDRIVTILRDLGPTLPPRAKVFLVQTQTEYKMQDVNNLLTKAVLKEGVAQDLLKVSAKTGDGLERLKERLAKEISWSDARLAIQSQAVSGLEAVLKSLREENIPVATLRDVATAYEKTTSQEISLKHLEFLLKEYADQGAIDYAPEIADLIILDDPDYNEVRTLVGHAVHQHNGIVSLEVLRSQVQRDPRFVEILDQYYRRTGVAIENGSKGLRIFPKLLRQGGASPPTAYRDQFAAAGTPRWLEFESERIDLKPLLLALSELGMDCIDATTSEGVFSWGGRGSVYYSVTVEGDAVTGRRGRITYYAGGSDRTTRERAGTLLEELLVRLYGSPVSSSSEEEAKKKAHQPEGRAYDVALSYASEQLSFVRQVADRLIGQGVRVFFDRLEKYHLAGKDLAEHLDWVFSERARYCMMFVSKEYVESPWPTHERRAAISRQIKQGGDYIIPIRFDATLVPGLGTSVNYLVATEETPLSIADGFIKEHMVLTE
jgi:GTPase SAR1 family protein